MTSQEDLPLGLAPPQLDFGTFELQISFYLRLLFDL